MIRKYFYFWKDYKDFCRILKQGKTGSVKTIPGSLRLYDEGW
jgi:hypothetical protein